MAAAAPNSRPWRGGLHPRKHAKPRALHWCPLLVRRQTRAAGQADPVAQYLTAHNKGDAHALETVWPGLQHCAVTDDGVRCALEYNCVRWGRHDLPPQAGIGIYERGPDGLMAAVRVYDDVEPPAELP
jgi:hypothetical protein